MIVFSRLRGEQRDIFPFPTAPMSAPPAAAYGSSV